MTVNKIFKPKDISKPYIPIDREVKIAKKIVLIKKFTNDIFKFIFALFIACKVVSKGPSK